MRTVYLNALLFIILIASFIGIQYGLVNNHTNAENLVWFKLSAFAFMIPLAYSSGTLFSPSFIKYPFHIIGAINLVAIIAAVYLREFNLFYFMKILVALLVGSIVAISIAILLRKNSLNYKNRFNNKKRK